MTSSLINRDGINPLNLVWGSSKSATMTASEKIATSSPSSFDGVRRICDAVFMHCKSKLHQSLVKLCLCPVSSPIEPKSRVFPSTASQMLKYKKETIKHDKWGYFPDFESQQPWKNLVSSRILNNYGYKEVTESNKIVLSKHGVFISFGYLSNQMFKLNIVNDIELRKIKRNRTLKNFGLEFQFYLIEGTMDEVSNQHSYCLNVKDEPKTFDKAMKFHDVAFWKEAINDEMDSIMGNNTWVLADLLPGCKPLSCK
ncbi:hypothetical protein Tco_0673651 [Tanacetum coccineum]